MKVFGNGFGMGAPFWDQTFYWLVDTSEGRDSGKGRFYSWIGGHGAQLTSFEFFCPRGGTERILAGRKFTVFNVSRGRFGLMWSVAWATPLPQGIDKANAELRAIKDALGNIIS